MQPTFQSPSSSIRQVSESIHKSDSDEVIRNNMPQRKDTPAARAALARRRQRAAQTLETPPLPPSSSSSGPSNAPVGMPTKIAASTTTTTTTNRIIKVQPPQVKANNSIGKNEKRQGATNHQNASEKKVEKKISTSGQRVNVRTEKQNGLSTTPSTVDDFNIETVLQDTTKEFSEPQDRYPEIYERISNFGSVKITSPQPIVPDRRGLTRVGSSSSSSMKGRTSANGGNSVTSRSRSKGPPIPSLAKSAPNRKERSAKTTATTSRKPSSNTTKKPKSSTVATPKSPPRTQKAQTKQDSIPSQTKNINPDANRSLPRRSVSPRRRSSPVKRVSPHRFRMHTTNNTTNKANSKAPLPKANATVPKATSASNGTSRYTATNREKSKMRLRQSAQATSPVPDKTIAKKNSPPPPARPRSISPVRRFPPASPSNENINEDLTAYLNDSCYIEEGSLIPDADKSQRAKSPDLSSQREQDENSRSPFVIRQRLSPRTYPRDPNRAAADENDARRWNVRPQSPKPITQKFAIKGPFVSPTKGSQQGNGIEKNTLQSRKELQNIDAACLCSGDLIMLRSSSTSTTVQKAKNEIIAQFDGQSLGKDEEMLRIVNIEDYDSSPLMFGDIVILQSLTNERALGARRRRKDINGKDEIGFFEVGDKEYSRWVVRPAESGARIVVGRYALTEGNMGNVNPSPVRSGNSITLLNCYNGGLLSLRGGVATLLTDSYDPNRVIDNPSLLGRTNDRLEPSVSESFQFLKLSIPPCPTWVTPNGMGERHFLNGTYLTEPFRNQEEPILVEKNLTLLRKENILVDEVIGSFLGLEGLYIKLQDSEQQLNSEKLQRFQLCDSDDTTFDLSLRNLVEQILPLSTSYLCVRDFIGAHYPGYEHGRVMQAFCEGLDTFLQQFVSFVAQLEQKLRTPPPTGALTMKNIHFEITPLLHSMSILENTTKAVRGKKGGALINALRTLEKTVYMGDTVAKDLLGTLLDRSSVPYAEILSIWLQSGRLHDPYEEFMVKKTQYAQNGVELDGDTWAELFTFSEEHVINDIVRNEKIKNRILVTGKYWNAVQACIVDHMSSEETTSTHLALRKLQFQSDLSDISAYINSMYESASSKLMHLLRDQYHLGESLQIMKRYFLLDQGDFLVNFLEATGEELSKPVEEVSIGRVQHFLGNSIQFTEAQREYAALPTSFGVGKRRKLSPSNLRCRLSEQSLVSYLDSLYGGIDDLDPNTPSRQKYGSQKQGTAGFDFFEIDFSRVPFPISLIISPTSMEHYKLLFRHLFFAKHVERRLVGVWSDHQVLKKLDALRGLLGPTFLLRQRMQHCVQNLMYYMSFEVVESNWLEMLSSIEIPDDGMSNQKEQTVDDLFDIHDGFLQKTMDSCLLTNPDLIKSLIKLLNTCLLFTDQMKRFMDTTKIVSAMHPDDVVHNCSSKSTTGPLTNSFLLVFL